MDRVGLSEIRERGRDLTELMTALPLDRGRADTVRPLVDQRACSPTPSNTISSCCTPRTLHQAKTPRIARASQAGSRIGMRTRCVLHTKKERRQVQLTGDTPRLATLEESLNPGCAVSCRHGGRLARATHRRKELVRLRTVRRTLALARNPRRVEQSLPELRLRPP